MKKKLKCLFIVLLFSLTSLYATYPKVAVVLSGGGAKGFAQIAVIEEMQKLGIPIDFICGTSMGGLIGAYYSIGYTSNDLKKIIINNSLVDAVFNMPDSYSANPPSLSRKDEGLKLSIGFNEHGIGNNPGILSDQGIISFINKTTFKSFGEKDFSSCPIPYKAMAVNVETGLPKIIETGYISDAMRATMSIPVLFYPYMLKDGTYCMDGGIADNLPVKLAQDFGADIIISVDVSSDGLMDIEGFSSLSGILVQTFRLTTFRGREDSQNASDIVIKPDVSNYLILDVGKYEEILEKGYEAFEDNKEFFIELRDEIKKYRELKFVDEDTISYYSQIQDPLIKSIKFEKINYDGNYSFSNIFDKYINKRINNELLDELDKDVKSFALLNNISTVTYNFHVTNEENVEGYLEIGMRNWKDSSSEIDFIVSSKIGISNNIINKSWFNNSLNIHTTVKDLVAENIKIDLDLSISDALTLRAKIGSDILNQNKSALEAFFVFKGNFGALSPANVRYAKYYVPSFSYGFDIGAGLDFQVSNKFSMLTSIDYNLISLSNPSFLNSSLNIKFEETPLSFFGLNFNFAYLNSRDSIFSDSGYGIKGKNALYFNNKDLNGYLHLMGKYDLPINDLNTLKFNLEFGFSSANYQLTTSYFDLGGYSKVPGYYFGSFTREYLLAGITYQRKLTNFFEDMFFQTGIKFFGLDSYSPETEIFISNASNILNAPSLKIPSLTDYNAGIFAGIGISTDLGQIIFGTGFSFNGNFNIVLEFV